MIQWDGLPVGIIYTVKSSKSCEQSLKLEYDDTPAIIMN